MEKKPLLDTPLKTLALILLTLALGSCALPGIAILHDPLTAEEHVNLGVSYERRGELDAALEEYKAAVKKMPLAYLYAGNVYVQQKRFEDARKSYKKAIAKTGSPEAYNNLAWLYYTTGADMAEAEQLAMKAVELSPDSETFKDTLRKIRERREGKPDSPTVD
jgi:tetratricopeptide (TPR) repeat protein